VLSSESALAPELPVAVASELNQYAAALRTDQDGVPVLLRSICKQLDIRVRRHSEVPNGKAYLAWDRQTESAPTILLPLNGNARWDRFCAAHELGHYFLVSRYDWIPEGSKAYWQTELLCDHFARKLLLPDDQLPAWLGEPREAADYLTKCDKIAATTITPWREVATAIAEVLPVVFFGIEPSERPGGFRVMSSSLPKRIGYRAEFAADSELVQLLNRSVERAAANQTRDDIKLNVRLFADTKLDRPLKKMGVAELTARIWPQGTRIKIATIPQSF
jgi:hypothetical protein